MAQTFVYWSPKLRSFELKLTKSTYDSSASQVTPVWGARAAEGARVGEGVGARTTTEGPRHTKDAGAFESSRANEGARAAGGRQGH